MPNEKSSKKMASLAGKVLHDHTASPEALSLAASVLSQAPDHEGTQSTEEVDQAATDDPQASSDPS